MKTCGVPADEQKGQVGLVSRRGRLRRRRKEAWQIRDCLEAGVCPDTLDDDLERGKMSALMWASLRGLTILAGILLEAGAGGTRQGSDQPNR